MVGVVHRKHPRKIAFLIGVNLLSRLCRETRRRRVFDTWRFSQARATARSAGTTEADLLALGGDVDTDDSSRLGQRRPAAHAGIGRSGEMDLGIKRMLQQSIVGALDDRQAKIARMAERIKPRALIDGFRFQSQITLVVSVGAQHRKIVNHVDADHSCLCSFVRHTPVTSMRYRSGE